MSQADGVVANNSGAAVRADINGQLAAVFTNHSGPIQPADIKPHQWWYDETTDILKFRNENSGWTSMREDDGKVILPSGTATSPSLYFDGQTNTGLYEYADDVIGITRDGTAYGVIGRTLQNQTNAFVIGPAATRSTALTPSNSTTDATASGFCVSSAGALHIGTEARPLTLNRITSSATGGLVNFNYAGVFRAAIQFNGAQILYNQTSDYRLKENVTALTGAKNRVNQLNPVRFNFISHPDLTVDGFLAHEAETAVPQAITGEKDAVFDDGSPKYQQIDQSQIVPLLTAALQEAFAEIDALRTRVETLEAG